MKIHNSQQDNNDGDSRELESFVHFFYMFVSDFEENIPIVIKIVLRLMYDILIQFFPKEKCYYPLFTFLIFNFLTSPKIQDIYNISPSSNKYVKELNIIIHVLNKII